jgi:hypothetical protein
MFVVSVVRLIMMESISGNILTILYARGMMENKIIKKVCDLLEKKKVGFMVSYISGGYVNLNPSDVVLYVSLSEIEFWAKYFNVSVECVNDFLTFNESGHCEAKTKNGKTCKNFVFQSGLNMGIEEFNQLRIVNMLSKRFCHIHKKQLKGNQKNG